MFIPMIKCRDGEVICHLYYPTITQALEGEYYRGINSRCGLLELANLGLPFIPSSDFHWRVDCRLDTAKTFIGGLGF